MGNTGTHLAKILGFNTRSRFDLLSPTSKQSQFKEGALFGSHVEVKLASHAIWAWLVNRKIIGPADTEVTYENISRLKTIPWTTARPIPHYEIFFSRHPCRNCINFVNRLSEVSGISILLHWRHRLTEMVYESGADNYEDEGLGPTDEEYRQRAQEEIVVIGSGPEKSNGIRTPKTAASEKDPRLVEKPLPATPVKEAPQEIVYNSLTRPRSWFRDASTFL